MAASTLVAAGVRVTLLDSGRTRPKGLIVRVAGNTVFRYTSRARMRSDEHRAVRDLETQWHHSLSQGGRSNYWTAAVPRFDPEDFREGARLDERYRWPLTYEDLVPFYEIAEDVLEVSGSPIAVRNLPANKVRHSLTLPGAWADGARRLEEHGIGLTPLPMAKGSPNMIALRTTEFNSATCLIDGLQGRPGFEMISGAHVRRLVMSATSDRVEAVEYLDRESRTTRRIAADAVVVAAGAINSTRILQSSTTSDSPDGLGNSRGLLGRYLHDHPRDWWSFTLSRSIRLPHHPVYMTRSDPAASEPLMAASATIGLASPKDRLRTYVRGAGRRLGVQIFGTMVPTQENAVSPSTTSVDEFGVATPEISMRYDDASRRNVETARRRVIEAFRIMGYDIDGQADPPDLQPGSSVHYGGSVRMHTSRDHGVLDAWNRVHDVPNVIVADLSCFTTGPEKNPTLTAMALAARAADRLVQDLLGDSHS